MSGVVTFLIFPSKSLVIPETVVPPLSICVATAVSICKKFIFDPVVETNVGFSVIEAVSLGVTLALKATNVASVFVPSVNIVLP